MKLLIITHLIPYPLSEGGKISQYALIDYLRNKCAITLVVFAYSDADEKLIHHLQQAWPDVCIEVISPQVPAPLQAKGTIRRKAKAFCKAVLHKANIAYGKLFSEDGLPPMTAEENLIGLTEFARPRERKVIDRVAAIVSKVRPHLVQMEFVYTLDLVLALPKELKKIFVHHELRYMRLKTEHAILSVGNEVYDRYLRRFCELTEIGLLQHFDGIMTLSEDDREHLQQKLPGKTVFSSPFPVLDSEFRPIQRQNQLVKKLVFMGSELHSPNKDAVEWYLATMANAIFEMHGLVLHVIGHWSEQTISLYRGNPYVSFAGFVEDAGAFCQNSIMIVPLRIGSGIRAKILYAAAWGIPVISTMLGSEGILESNRFCVTANSPGEFLAAVTTLLADPEKCYEQISDAQKIIWKHYSQQAAGEKRLSFYNAVLQGQTCASVL